MPNIGGHWSLNCQARQQQDISYNTIEVLSLYCTLSFFFISMPMYHDLCLCSAIHAPPTPIILYAAPITEHYRSSIKDYRSCRGMYDYNVIRNDTIRKLAMAIVFFIISASLLKITRFVRALQAGPSLAIHKACNKIPPNSNKVKLVFIKTF